jgi:pimeloyl-ACP methyl ester carboxylesterase
LQGRRRHLRTRRALLAIVPVAVLAAAVIGLVPIASSSQTIPAFYDWSGPIPATPGQLLRVEPYRGVVPGGSKGWVILYSSRTSAGARALGSAVVLVPPRHQQSAPVVVWDHGTTGIARACAPSLERETYEYVPFLGGALNRGWVVVAPDYVGLGTAGPPAYLVGPGEAYSTLDAVIAAHSLPERAKQRFRLSDATVVWGHSQGGHAALWTGILAPRYAPGLSLDGVAAISPATDLEPLARGDTDLFGTTLLETYVLQAYAENYPNIHVNSYIRQGAEAQVAAVAGGCLASSSALAPALESLSSSGGVLARNLSTGTLGARLVQNIPAQHISAPLLVAQGADDHLIPISVTRRWVTQRCDAGQSLEFRSYPGRTHTSIVAFGSPLNSYLLRWTAARFAGKRPPRTCG